MNKTGAQEGFNYTGLAEPATAKARWISPTQFGGVLMGCFALHVLLRCAVSEGVGNDDADQVLRAQIWDWGYGPQPPLYTWLTKIFLGLLGSSAFPLLLLKELLMLSLYAVVYAAAHRVTGSARRALLAAALLQFNHSIAWESHRDLTHTVLASLLAVASIYLLLGLDPKRWTTYLWFGLVSGLGLLSKYNYAIVWLCLWLGALSVREFRSRLLNPKMAGGALLAAAICAPHFVWVFQHRRLAFSSVPKLELAPSTEWLQALGGLGAWFGAVLAQAGPMLLLAAVVFGRGFKGGFGTNPAVVFLQRALLASIVLVAAAILFFRVTEVRDRYAQPLLIGTPILLVARLPAPLPRPKFARVATASLASAALIAAAAPGRLLLTDWLNKKEVLNLPLRQIAEELQASADNADCLIAENHKLAGNLALWFPHKLVVNPDVGPLFRAGPRRGLMIWDAESNRPPPDDLLKFAKRFTGNGTVRETRLLEKRLKHHRLRTAQLGVSVVH